MLRFLIPGCAIMRKTGCKPRHSPANGSKGGHGIPRFGRAPAALHPTHEPVEHDPLLAVIEKDQKEFDHLREQGHLEVTDEQVLRLFPIRMTDGCGWDAHTRSGRCAIGLGAWERRRWEEVGELISGSAQAPSPNAQAPTPMLW